MKVAISSRNPNLDSYLDERFGRAPHFIIYDLDNNTYHSIDNLQNLNSAQGAGIQTAQNITKTGVEALITGNVGPKAFQVLQAAGIDIYLSRSSTIKEAINNFKAGKLTKTTTNNVESHWV